MRYKKTVTFFALAIVMFVTIYPRIQTYFLPFTKRLAERSVYNEIANQSKDYIKGLYKHDITVTEQDEYVAEEYKKRLKNKKEIEIKIQERIKEEKSKWQNDKQQTYLLEFDPYYLYRYTGNLVEQGTISDKIKDGKLYDTYSYAPEGKIINPRLIIYIGYFFHKICVFFNKGLPLVNTLFVIPLILAVLVSLVIFFFVKRFFGLFVAFLSTFVITLTPIFLSRSMCGWFDTDCFNLLFPFLTTFLFFLAIKQNKLKKSITMISLTSLSLGVYSLGWHGWWHCLYFILAGTFLYALNTAETYFKYKDNEAGVELKKILVLSGSFLIITFIFVLLITGQSAIIDLFRGPLDVLRSVYAKQSFRAMVWPNTFLTVAELRPSDLIHIVYLAGNPFIFFMAFIGLFLLIKPRDGQDQRLQYIGFVFAVWLVLGVFTSLRAVRFALILAVPQGICFAIAVKYVIELFFKRFQLYSHKERLFFKAVCFILITLFMSILFVEQFYNARITRPMLNDDYVNVLERIKQDSPKETIINSWWDYGSWYTAIGQRRVIFDGTTQHLPTAFWMAKVLLTDDEKEAIGILGMMNNGSNKAFDKLKDAGLEDIDAIKLLRKIILVEKKEAEILLKKMVSQKEASEIIEYTHSLPPSAYFIVDEHMIDIIGALSLLGNWSSQKAYLWQVAHAENKSDALRDIQQKLDYTENETVKLYQEALSLGNKDLKKWASRIFNFHSPLSNSTEEGNMLLFDNDVAVDLNNFNARIKTNKENSWKRPYSLIYLEGGTFKEIIYDDIDIPFTILLVPEDNSYKSIIIDRDLAKSMLVRLLFLKGYGLKHFKFLFSEKEEGFGNINVWEIDWEGHKENILSLDNNSE